MKRLLRFWIGVLASLAFASFAIAVLVYEIRFGLQALSTTATVERYTDRKIFGRGGGTVVHEVDGKPVKATFRSWYVYRGPGEGERVPVLYLPTEPDRVTLDSFLQRYGPLVFPLILALAAASWAGVFRRHGEAPNPRLRSEAGRGAEEPPPRT